MEIKYLLHESSSTDTTRIVHKPADLTGFKACWITFHLVLIFLTYSCLLKLMTMYISYPAWNAALSDTLWQSLWQRLRTNTSLNRHEIFRFLSYFIIFAPFSIFLIIKSVCIRCLCLRLIHSAERKKKNLYMDFFFFFFVSAVRRHPYATSTRALTRQHTDLNVWFWAYGGGLQ